MPCLGPMCQSYKGSKFDLCMTHRIDIEALLRWWSHSFICICWAIFKGVGSSIVSIFIMVISIDLIIFPIDITCGG